MMAGRDSSVSGLLSATTINRSITHCDCIGSFSSIRARSERSATQSSAQSQLAASFGGRSPVFLETAQNGGFEDILAEKNNATAVSRASSQPGSRHADISRRLASGTPEEGSWPMTVNLDLVQHRRLHPVRRDRRHPAAEV
jgi:hypothetical protein